MTDWILASASPRRRELLKTIIPDYRVVKSEVEEWEPLEADAADMVLKNALSKARQVASRYPQSIVIAADTTVSLGKRIYNKPVDNLDAERILAELSGQTHTVSTGVAVIGNGREDSFVEASLVTFKILSSEAIHNYIEIVHVLDKAGAYGIQNQGELIISQWEGSMDNIMGLPIEQLRKILIQRKDLVSH